MPKLRQYLTDESDMPTRTRVHRQPTWLQVEDILPTNEADLSNPRKGRSNLPICVVKIGTSYYVVDGNCRLAYRRKRGWKLISAWILIDNDKSLVYGKVITGEIKDWKNGNITFEQLCDNTVEAHNKLDI